MSEIQIRIVTAQGKTHSFLIIETETIATFAKMVCDRFGFQISELSLKHAGKPILLHVAEEISKTLEQYGIEDGSCIY